MKKIILITILMSAVFAQSDCNESNWGEYYASDGRNMSECDLRGANIRGANLNLANLKEADIDGANLRGATLRSANLRYATLRSTFLEGADLTEADLEGAVLANATPSSANLTNANLEGVTLTKTYNFNSANLEGVTSGNITGEPYRGLLPERWSLVNGVLIYDGGERFDALGGEFVSEFENIDENNDGCISIKEFQKFWDEN